MVCKAVFFDLDGTLRLTTPSPPVAFVQLARSLQIELDDEAERRVTRWAHRYWGEATAVQQDITQVDQDLFWLDYSKKLLTIVNVSQQLHERAQLVRDWFYTEYKPLVTTAPGAYETLCALREQKLHIGLITNRSAPANGTLAEMALDDLFDFALAAGEVGSWKPHEKIFRAALQKIDGLQPDECVYIGDNYYADCLGAAAVGITPILFDPDDLYEDVDCLRIRQISDVWTVLKLPVSV